MLVTMAQYARLAGISRQAVESKILRGIIKPEFIEIAGKTYKQIDTVKYPPKQL